MSRQKIRKKSGRYTRETRRHLNRCTRSYRVQQKNALNVFTRSITHSGICYLSDIIYIPGWCNLQGDATKNLLGSSYTLVGINSPTFNRRQGLFTGIGSSAAWDTGFVPSVEAVAGSRFQLNDAFHGRFVLEDGTAGTLFDFGSTNTASAQRTVFNPRNASNVFVSRVNSSTNTSSTLGGNSTLGTRWLASARIASGQARLYTETAIEDILTVSSVLSDNPIYLGANCGFNLTPQSPTDRTIGLFVMGAFIDGIAHPKLHHCVYRFMRHSFVPF